ncbi:uncharacterized protein LOC143576518 [Bidens hawaiensis]|uniref:uncharacterized protein LOC143576518 n=1 Tax=Bidens hawaiensis TaxID=980011 RepID=UPI00404ACB78
MDKSWMSTDRCQQRYVDGVESFLKFAAANLKVSEIPCPCVDCLNHICHPVDTVEHHLYMWGINQNYTCWIKHGEKEEPTTKIDDMETKFGDPEFPTDAMETIEMVQATEEFVDPEKYQELVVEAEKPLYEGCPNFTKLSALVALLNIKSKYGVTSNCLTEILVLLKKMLPEGNEIVNNTYEAKKAMKAIGSGYEKIHACINNCILYRHSYKNLLECPTCGKSRWKVDEKTKRVYENVPANRFTLRAVVLWTINDYPALGTLCGCPYSGFNGCVVCQQKTVCIRLPDSAKQSYGGHRRYLPKYHPFRKQLVFNGKEEKETVGNVITEEQIYDQVKLVMNKCGKEPAETSTGRGGKTTMVQWLYIVAAQEP